MIVTFDLLLYALLINLISAGITSVEQLPSFPIFLNQSARCVHEYVMHTERGKKGESETSSRRNVSLIWKTEREWKKRRKVTAWSTARLISAHFICTSSYWLYYVGALPFLGKYLIMIRYNDQISFPFLSYSGFISWVISQWFNLCAALTHVPILTLSTSPYQLWKGVYINSLRMSALVNCTPSFHEPVKIKILSQHHPLNAFSIYREYIRMILRILNLSSWDGDGLISHECHN